MAIDDLVLENLDKVEEELTKVLNKDFVVPDDFEEVTLTYKSLERFQLNLRARQRELENNSFSEYEVTKNKVEVRKLHSLNNLITSYASLQRRDIASIEFPEIENTKSKWKRLDNIEKVQRNNTIKSQLESLDKQLEKLQSFKLPEYRSAIKKFSPNQDNQISMMKEMRSMYFKQQKCSVLVPLKRNYPIEQIEEESFGASKITGGNFHPLKTIPYVVFEFDGNTDVFADIRKHYSIFDSPLDINLFFPPEKFSGVYKITKNSDLWNHNSINRDQAYEIESGSNATVAIIDTGCDYTHPEIRDRFGTVKGVNIIDGTNDPMDDDGHGTHCAGIVAGKNVGVSQAELYAIKVLGEYGGSEADVIRGIEHAILNDIPIANMSLGGSTSSRAMHAICRAAYERGVFLFGAAGNEGAYDEPSFPGACFGVFQVAAYNIREKVANFSNKNDAMDLAAPGVDIYSSILDGRYANWDGTSMATPHCAGVAALMKSSNPNLTPQEFDDLLCNGALTESLGEDFKAQGYGKIMADKAVYSQIKEVA